MLCACCGLSTDSGDRCSACGSPPLLAGCYRLLALLGEGSTGATYAAERLADKERVAIKELILRRATTAKQRELYLREASVLQQLEHPGIPRYLEHFTAGIGRNRALYLVEELIDGHSLQQELSAHRYDEEEVVGVVREVLGILAYLHTRSPPVIHRDLKPSNVIRRATGRLVLVDFGSVRDAIEDQDLGGSTVAGTFGFMAPEQFMGSATPATDLYGVGALAVSLLSRIPPHRLLDHGGRLHWEGAISVSERMRRLLRGLLAPDPSHRLQTVAAAFALLDGPRGTKPPARLAIRGPVEAPVPLPRLLSLVRRLRQSPPSAVLEAPTARSGSDGLTPAPTPTPYAPIAGAMLGITALPMAATLALSAPLALPPPAAPPVQLSPGEELAFDLWETRAEAEIRVQRCLHDLEADAVTLRLSAHPDHGVVLIPSQRDILEMCVYDALPPLQIVLPDGWEEAVELEQQVRRAVGLDNQ